jgi:hypothetical protein
VKQQKGRPSCCSSMKVDIVDSLTHPLSSGDRSRTEQSDEVDSVGMGDNVDDDGCWVDDAGALPAVSGLITVKQEKGRPSYCSSMKVDKYIVDSLTRLYGGQGVAAALHCPAG